MSDFTSKYNGYLGIPNEGSGIRVRLENETDNIEYSTSGENLTDFLDNLYQHAHQSLDSVYAHLINYSNPHHVTAEQLGSVTLANDEVISGNKTFVGSVVLNNVSFPNGITLDSDTVFTGDGSGLTNLSIPNLVYTNKQNQMINGSLVLNSDDEASFLEIGQYDGAIRLSKSNNGSFISITSNDNKSICVDTNSVVGNYDESNTDAIGVSWTVPNMTGKLDFVDKNNINVTPNNAIITLGVNNISPLYQYPISLGSTNSPWNNIYGNNIYLGSSTSMTQSTLHINSSVFASSNMVCTNQQGGSSGIIKLAGMGFFQVDMGSSPPTGSTDVYKNITFASSQINKDTLNVDRTLQNNSISLSWKINDNKAIKSGISFTETGVSPIFNGFVDLGDSNHQWKKIYSDNLVVNNISINGTDLDTKLNNLTPELPANLVYTDAEKTQNISSSISIIKDGGSFLLSDNNKGGYIVQNTNNNSPCISLVSHLSNTISSSFKMNRDSSNTGTFLASWRIPGQQIDKRNVDGTFTNQGASPFAYMFFTNGSVNPDGNYPINLGTENNRWHNVCTAILNAESIVIDGKDLTNFVKDTMSSELEIIKQRIDAGDAKTIEELKSYTNNSIFTLSNEVDTKINNIDTSVALTQEIKSYIDEVVTQKCSGIITAVTLSSESTNNDNIMTVDTNSDITDRSVYSDIMPYTSASLLKLTKEV